MKAWASSLDPSGSSNIRFLADPDATFTRALELDFTAPQIFGSAPRSKRYALIVGKGGAVEKVAVEPDNTGVDGKPYPSFPPLSLVVVGVPAVQIMRVPVV